MARLEIVYLKLLKYVVITAPATRDRTIRTTSRAGFETEKGERRALHTGHVRTHATQVGESRPLDVEQWIQFVVLCEWAYAQI